MIVEAASPYNLSLPIKQVAHKIYNRYFDLAEDTASAAIVEMVEASKSLMPRCGLALGLTGIRGKLYELC